MIYVEDKKWIDSMIDELKECIIDNSSWTRGMSYETDDFRIDVKGPTIEITIKNIFQDNISSYVESLLRFDNIRAEFIEIILIYDVLIDGFTNEVKYGFAMPLSKSVIDLSQYSSDVLFIVSNIYSLDESCLFTYKNMFGQLKTITGKEIQNDI